MTHKNGSTRNGDGPPRAKSAPAEAKHDTSDAEVLLNLVGILRALATSAENTAKSGDAEKIAIEMDRARRMILAWEAMRDHNDLDIRMHFTEGLDVFASATRNAVAAANAKAADERAEYLRKHPGETLPEPKKIESDDWTSVLDRARRLIAKMKMLDPVASRRLDEALVARAIAARATGRWDWEAVVKAWGRTDIVPHIWTAGWHAWKKTRENP
jgi:hypothetical protein